MTEFSFLCELIYHDYLIFLLVMQMRTCLCTTVIQYKPMNELSEDQQEQNNGDGEEETRLKVGG